MSSRISQVFFAVKRGRLLLIGGVTLAAIIAVAFVPRVRQSEAYHNFADRRPLLGAGNFLDRLGAGDGAAEESYVHKSR